MWRSDRLYIDPSAVNDLRATFAALFERNENGTIMDTLSGRRGLSGTYCSNACRQKACRD